MKNIYAVYTDEPVDMAHPLFMARSQARLAAQLVYRQGMPLGEAITTITRDIRAVMGDVPPSLVAATVTTSYLRLRAKA